MARLRGGGGLHPDSGVMPQILELDLDKCCAPASEAKGQFIFEAVALTSDAKAEATHFAMEVCKKAVSVVGASAAEQVCFTQPFYSHDGKRVGVRGWAVPAAFEALDGFFSPVGCVDLAASGGQMWSVSTRWLKRSMRHRLLLVGVPVVCTPRLLVQQLSGLTVKDCRVAPSAVKDYSGSANFSAYILEVEARSEHLPRALRLKSSTGSYTVRVDRYSPGRFVDVTPVGVPVAGSWAAVAAGRGGRQSPVSEPPSPTPGGPGVAVPVPAVSPSVTPVPPTTPPSPGVAASGVVAEVVLTASPATVAPSVTSTDANVTTSSPSPVAATIVERASSLSSDLVGSLPPGPPQLAITPPESTMAVDSLLGGRRRSPSPPSPPEPSPTFVFGGDGACVRGRRKAFRIKRA